MSRIETTALHPKVEANKFKRKQITNLDFEAIKLTDLNEREWFILENIHWWENVTPHEDKKVFMPNVVLASLFGLSVDRMKHIIHSLVQRKWLKRSGMSYLKTTAKWKKVVSFTGLPIPSDITPETIKLAEEPTPQDEKPKFYEDEFGPDTVSEVENAPTMNTIEKKVENLAKSKNKTLSKSELSAIASTFWLKEEECGWSDGVNYFSSLRRYFMNWLKNESEDFNKNNEKEPKIIRPKNIEEMRLFFKQLPDDVRRKVRAKREDDGLLIGFNHIGMPIAIEDGSIALTDDYCEKVLNHYLVNFDKFFGKR